MFKMMMVVPLLFLLSSCATNTHDLSNAKIVKGKIIKLIRLTKTFKLQTKNGTQIISYSDNTQFENCKGPAGLRPPTKVKLWINKKMVAKKIKVLLVTLPKEMIISTDELSSLYDSDKKFFIGDSRPYKKKYSYGHLKGAINTPPKKMKKSLLMLPKNKDALLVFYCGGTSCPLSPASGKIAKKAGYKNVKVYVAGYPAWKDMTFPVYVEPFDIKKRLNKHHVILDVREKANRHLKSAVHFPVAKLESMHDKFNADKVPAKKKILPGVGFKKAPIYIYGDEESTIEAYEYLSYWGYKNVAIIDGDFKKLAKMLPTSKGKIKTKITYVKKLIKGAAKIKDFVKAAKKGTSLIVDVRTNKEVQTGVIKGSIHIPFSTLSENLNKIPKNKKVILHCASGARASMGYDLLLAKGYKNVTFLDDSFNVVVQQYNIKLKE
jgi:rhodanese-related sulfurtransferase